MTGRAFCGVIVIVAAVGVASCTSGGAAQDVATTGAAPPTTQPAADSGSTVPSPADTDEVACSDAFNEAAGMMLDVDLDGDGDVELVAVDRPESGPTIIRVCGTDPDPEPYSIGDGGEAVEMSVIDIDGDGTAELLVGGPTDTEQFSGSVLRFEDGELIDLHLALAVAATGNTGASFACIDVDGDGALELVSQTYTFDADTREEASEVAWTQTVIFDDGVVDGPTTSGVLNLAEESDEVDALIEPTCGASALLDG